MRISDWSSDVCSSDLDRRWRWLTWRSHLDDDDAGKMGGTPPQPEGTADRHGRRRPALQSQEALPMAPARANPRPRLVTAAQPDADRPGTGLREVEAQIVEGAWLGASGLPPHWMPP